MQKSKNTMQTEDLRLSRLYHRLKIYKKEEIMHYKVLFRIEKFNLIDKLKHKITNYKRYCEEMGDTAEIEVVFAGDVVKYFENLENEFADSGLDIALCHNALTGQNMPDINYKNIRTVRAGIGEIISRKAEGFIEYTIE